MKSKTPLMLFRLMAGALSDPLYNIEHFQPPTTSSKINKTIKSNCEHLKICLTKASNNTFSDEFER